MRLVSVGSLPVGVIALIMGLARAAIGGAVEESVYGTGGRGLLVI